MDEVVIVDAIRTPLGKRNGWLWRRDGDRHRHRALE